MYKVLIKKCTDPGQARPIAEEIARWSGSSVEVVYNALTQKAVCIRKEADEQEANQLKSRFEGVGASVELVALDAAAPAAGGGGGGAPAGDEDEDAPGRLLSEQEYTDKLQRRSDIFYVEKNDRVRNTEIIALILALAAGIFLSNYEVKPRISADFLQIPDKETGKVKVVKETDILKKEEEKKEEEKKTEKKKLNQKKAKAKGSGGRTGGGGDPRARVTKKGVLGIISGKIKGKSVASADIFGKGGFASDIDGILQGVGGLKKGGSGGVGRKGAAGIGFGAGYGSGFGGGSGGVDDVIGNLLGGDGGSINLKKRGKIDLTPPKFTKGGALTGGRSQASIMRVVRQNLAALRYAYNKRLREKPGLGGKIKVKFAIDEFGKVIFCKVLESTMSDAQLEAEVVSKIKRWVFEKIDKPGDVTEVVYPFVFRQ